MANNRSRSNNQVRHTPWFIKYGLISLALGYCTLLLVLPLIAIFAIAFQEGWRAYLASFQDKSAQAAISMTILAALVSVPLNMIFGIAASWSIAKFSFRGKSLLLTLIDLPFGVSPIISGMLFVILFGAQGIFGQWLIEHDIKIIFALPGILLATTFVTFPYVARELIPLMQEQGSDEEFAAISLGATGWQTFWYITLPKIRWGLLYGVILCNARAMGEYGAVAVVAANVRGERNTLPLHIENMFTDGHIVAAFASASLLAMLGLVTLVIKAVLERKLQQQLAQV